MKTKLLKKIRKQYSIVYYPNRKTYSIMVHSELEYFLFSHLLTGIESKQKSLDNIMLMVRYRFKKYSRKYKLDQVRHKVWYNQPTSRNLTIDTDGDGSSY